MLLIKSLKNATVYFHKKKTKQWNIVEESKINPLSYNYLIFDKYAKNIRWRYNNLCNPSSAGKSRLLQVENEIKLFCVFLFKNKF